MDLKELKEIIRNEKNILINKSGIEETEKEKILLSTIKLNEEVGELCEEILKKFNNQKNEKIFSEKNLRGEIADVIITTMLLANKMNIDVEKALDEKVTEILARVKQ